MYNLLEAYSAVYNPDVKEDLDLQKDYISEMQIGNLTKSDLVEIAEEVVEIMLSSGISIKESQKIVGSLFTKSDITGRQQKIDRLQEAFSSAFRELTSKASDTAVEEFGKYRNSKKLQESWSARFNQDKRVERVHNRLVAEEIASTKELLILMIEEKDDSYLETDMKKRAKNNEKALADMKTTKAHKDMVGAARKAMGIGEALDPVGEEDDDVDNDGDSDSSDKYLKKRRKAISKAMGKKKDDDEELDEAMRPGPRQRAIAAKQYQPYKKGGGTYSSRDKAIAHNVAVRGDGPGTPGYEKKSTGGKGARYAGYGDQGAGNKARRRAGLEPLRGNRDPRNEEFDLFDTILEYLYVEGYVDTLEEAEWMMANIIDEEAIDIILGEGKKEFPHKKVDRQVYDAMDSGETAGDSGNRAKMKRDYGRAERMRSVAAKHGGKTRARTSEEFEAWLDEAMSNYEKNRKRAAQRAAARNEARRQGKTGAVPGVGYVTPRRERETWTDESGKTRHAKGL